MDRETVTATTRRHSSPQLVSMLFSAEELKVPRKITAAKDEFESSTMECSVEEYSKVKYTIDTVVNVGRI